MSLLMNDIPILVLGAGGHAKVLIDALLLLNRKMIGVIDVDTSTIGTKILGVSIIGNDDTVLHYPIDAVQLLNGLGSTCSTRLRKQLMLKFTERGYQFASVVHPSSIVAHNVKCNDGVQIMAGAVIQTGCYIGTNSIVNTRASIDHDCIIGDHVHIAPGVTLSGGVEVGNNVHIGTGATVIQGIKIGEDSVIAAGTVVIDNVPFGATVMGVPGKVVKQ